MSLLQPKFLVVFSAFFLVQIGGFELAAARDRVEIDEKVVIEAGASDDEIVAIGGSVEVTGDVARELVAIGGEVMVDANVTDKAVIGGGEVDVRGTFDNELVIFGGEIDFSGATGEVFVAFGGMISIDDTSILSNETRLFGGELVLGGTYTGSTEVAAGEVDARGQFAGKTYIGGEHVSVSGQFFDDLTLEGDEISFKDGAVIGGTLLIRSPEEPEIPEWLGLDESRYSYEHIESYDPKIGKVRLSDIGMALGALALVVLVFLLISFALALVVVVSSNRLTSQSAIAIKEMPIKSFFIGILASLGVGVLGAILTIVLIGAFLPFIFGIVGFLVAGFTISALLFKKVGEPLHSGQRVGYVLLGSLLLIAVAMVPILGTLVVIVVTFLGMGAFTLALFDKVETHGDHDGMQMGHSQPQDGHPIEAYDDGHPPEPVYDEPEGEEGDLDGDGKDEPRG